MADPTNYQIIDLVIKALGLGGTAVAAVVGARTFVRNEKWKRTEFLAKEMKEFLAAEPVKNALTMIDWAERDIKLLSATPPSTSVVRVTQWMSGRALFPHMLDGAVAEGETSAVDGEGMRPFTSVESAIRDCFDALLDGLERFSAYRKSNLITIEQLRPYLDYWITDIARDATGEMEATFCAALITYIHVYGFVGVAELFAEWGHPIDPQSRIYTGFLDKMGKDSVREELRKLAVEHYAKSRPQAS